MPALPAMRKAISDPLAWFDPEISLDMSYDSPPMVMTEKARLCDT